MRFTPLLFCLLLTRASYAELTIFDVRRNLPLSDSEKVYHDYLVDSGVEAGLKQGMTLTVSRKLPVYDYYRFKSVGDLALKVAKVKVIAVQDGLSVVRLREDIARQDLPILQDDFIMIGDKLDMTTVVADSSGSATEAVAVVPAAIAIPANPMTPSVAGSNGSAIATIVVNSVDLTPKDAPVTVPPAAGAPATSPSPRIPASTK